MATDVAKFGMRSFQNSLLVMVPSLKWYPYYSISKIAVSNEAPVYDSISHLIF